MRRFTWIVGLLLAAATTVLAQEGISGGGPKEPLRPGWTLTPVFTFNETYDNNISLFGRGTAEEQNDDYIASFAPALDLGYHGKHTNLGVGYTGTFLNYRTFSALNRWNQQARVNLK